MIELLPFVVTALVSASVGGAGIYALTRRPGKTREWAIKEATRLMKLAQKLPGAADGEERILEAKKAEAAALSALESAKAKLGAQP